MLRVDENYNIFLTRGDSATFNLTIYEDDGETPYIMQPGDTLLFTVRRLYDKGEILITKVFNTLSFQILPTDTANLTTGKYKYDICIYNGSGWIDTFLNEKIFELGEEVHDFA